MNVKDTVFNHFGFARMPFGKDVPIERVFPTASLGETTAMLSLGLDCEDLMLITGVIGMTARAGIRVSAPPWS